MITLQTLIKAKWIGGGANEWVRTGRRCPSCTGLRRRARRQTFYRGRLRAKRSKRSRRRCVMGPRCTCKKKPVYQGEWATTIEGITFTLKRADGVVAAYADTEIGDVYSNDRKTRRAALEDVVRALRELVQRRSRQVADLSTHLW